MPRGDRDVDFASVGDVVSVEVEAVEARNSTTPRVTLRIVEPVAVEDEEAEVLPAPAVSRAPPRREPEPEAVSRAPPRREPEPEPVDLDDIDDIDDIEASLGLDEY